MSNIRFAIIMGATSGIGYEVARTDDSTVNLDRNESEMKEVAKSLVLQT